jgi:hypothetical protein
MSVVNLIAASVGVKKRQDGKGGSTARASPTVFFVVSKNINDKKRV